MPIRWGFVGAGRISHDLSIVFKTLSPEDHKILAIASRNQSTAHQFACDHGIPRAYGSYEELMQDKQVDAVYVAVINNYHLPVVKLALENDKHVLVEKPLAMNATEAKEMIELARSKKKFLMEAIWSRFLPTYRFVVEQIKKGVIGDIHHISVDHGTYMMDNSRVITKELGGSVILDIGVYAINVVQQVVNGQKPQKVVAVGQVNEQGVDEVCSASLLYPNGQSATINLSTRTEYSKEATIFGSTGFIKILSPYQGSEVVKINDKLHEFSFPDPPKTSKELFYGRSMMGLAYQFAEIKKCINSGEIESSVLSHEESLTIAEIQDKLRNLIGAK